MKPFISLISLSLMYLISISILSSCSSEEVKYFDQDWIESPKESAVYKRVITNDDGKYSIVKDYYVSNNNLQFNGRMSDVENETTEGTCIWYYESGSKQQLAQMKSGKIEGSFKAWHENGKLMFEGYGADDRLNGYSTWYYDNGEKLIEAMYKDDLQVGLTKKYYRNGNLFTEVDSDETNQFYYNENGNSLFFLNTTENITKYFHPEEKLAFEISGIPFLLYTTGNFADKYGVISYYDTDGSSLLSFNVKRGEISLKDRNSNYNQNTLLKKVQSIEEEMMRELDKISNTEETIGELIEVFGDRWE